MCVGVLLAGLAMPPAPSAQISTAVRDRTQIAAGSGPSPQLAEPTRHTTPHLEVTTYPVPGEVAAGSRVALTIDVTPRRGMHLYAPGAEGYRSIALTITPNLVVRAQPVKYPAGEVYFFEPLNERVPVYQKRFTIVQELLLQNTRDARTALRGKRELVVNGTFEYQACDDKVCFNPVSVPLEWRVKLRSTANEAQEAR